MEAVARLTYQRGLGAGFVNDAATLRRLRLFSEKGMLRVLLLEVKEAPCAFWIGFRQGTTFFSSATGYLPEFRTYEIGTLVFLRMVDELIAEGVECVDFGLGDASYKERFGTHHALAASFHWFAPTVRGSVLWGSTLVASETERLLRALVERLRLTTRLKTLWRRQIASKSPEDR